MDHRNRNINYSSDLVERDRAQGMAGRQAPGSTPVTLHTHTSTPNSARTGREGQVSVGWSGGASGGAASCCH